MAKKLDVELKFTTKNIEVCGEQIEVKQYLPVVEKLNFISDVLMLSADENNFPNDIKIEVFSCLNMIKYYTDIEITDEDMENPTEIYDKFQTNDVFNLVVAAIPQAEYDELIKGMYKVIDDYYKYQTSALGIMSAISQDYSQLNFDATNIQNKIADPENLTLLKDVMTKLG